LGRAITAFGRFAREFGTVADNLGRVSVDLARVSVDLARVYTLYGRLPILLTAAEQLQRNGEFGVSSLGMYYTLILKSSYYFVR